jgi:hypothetical protein
MARWQEDHAYMSFSSAFFFFSKNLLDALVCFYLVSISLMDAFVCNLLTSIKRQL